MSELYKHHLYATGKHYGTRPNFISRNHLPNTGFASIYAVTEATAKAIEQAGSAQGFKGVVWSPFLQVDVDSYEAAEIVENKLKGLGLQFVAYDSGGKGAHFEVVRDAPPSHRLPARDKAWVREVLPQADLSIYTHLHPFRIEGTVHEETGRKKEVVVRQDGMSLLLPVETTEPMPSSFATARGHRSVFDCFRIMSNTTGASIGDRHPQLVRLLYALKDDAGVDERAALWWITETNKLFEEPKSEEDLEKIVLSIYRS